MGQVSVIRTSARLVVECCAPRGSRRRDVLRRGNRLVTKRLPAWLRNWLHRRAGRWGAIFWPALDIYHPRHLNAFLVRHGAAPLTCSARDAEAGEFEAARFALALLQEQPELRQRFPQAILAGPDGDYCRWLCSDGARVFGLTANAVNHLRAAFARQLSYPVRKLYDYNRSLSRRFPLALTSEQRRPFARWLLTSGKREFGLRDEEILWFLFESAENSRRGLADSYLRHAHWQRRFPLGLTVFGQEALRAWVGKHYGVFAPWLRQADLSGVLHPVDEVRLLHAVDPSFHALAPLAFKDPRETALLVDALRRQQDRFPAADGRWWSVLETGLAAGLADKPGVNILGHFCFPSGLREAVLGMARALQVTGASTSCRDVPVPAVVRSEVTDRSAHLGLELFDVTVLAASVLSAPGAMYRRAGLGQRASVYRVGHWYWELGAIPPEFAEHARELDEIWAPTRFIAEALRRVLPIPVIDMPPGVRLNEVPTLPRSRFGLPDERFLFLFIFDMSSIMERKNPLGVIRAYRQAFGTHEPVALVIKVSHGENHPEELRRLRSAAEEAGVIVIDRILPREESYALLNACDCYISLHRAEGFGLTMAEAMLLAKPVIATGYSGNLDFMSPLNSLLVDYRLVPIGRDVPIYSKGDVWAEPSLDHAVRHLRWVYEHPGEARLLGERGRATTSRLLSVQAAGQRMRARLETIWSARRKCVGLAA